MRTTTYLAVALLMVSLGCAAQEASPSGQISDQPAKGVQRGRLIHKVSPVYPKDAKSKHVEGPVTLSAIITKEGKVRDIKFLTGDPLFRKAAIDAVSHWLYDPN